MKSDIDRQHDTDDSNDDDDDDDDDDDAVLTNLLPLCSTRCI